MKEKLISFEAACLAHDIGFDLFAQHYYSKEGRVITNRKYPDDCSIDNIYATTQSLLQKWLREQYRAHIIIEPRYTKENCTLTGKVDYYCWRGFVHVDPSTVGGVENTYEEALEKGLKTLMIAIKTKDPRVMHYRNSLLKISPYKPL